MLEWRNNFFYKINYFLIAILFFESKNNRIIIDPAQIPLALRCFITDQNQNPIPNVIVTIQGYKKNHKTSAKGRIQIKSLQSGNYSLTCQKFGYQTQVLSIPINKGERTDLRIILQPTP